MSFKEFKKLKVGDEVIVTCSLKDHYGEAWHSAGDKVKIKKFTKDDIGVIFRWSDLGISYKGIELRPKTVNV